jgi:hypothetical protein
MISVGSVYPIPQQLQGFAADDVTDTQPIDTAELLMGVDGKLSGGFIFVPVKQGIILQADSPSNDIFDTWYATEQTLKDKVIAQGVIVFPAIGKKWVMNNGFLSSFPTMPDAKKILQPRKFEITWESVSPAVTV